MAVLRSDPAAARAYWAAYYEREARRMRAVASQPRWRGIYDRSHHAGRAGFWAALAAAVAGFVLVPAVELALGDLPRLASRILFLAMVSGATVFSGSIGVGMWVASRAGRAIVKEESATQQVT